MKVIVFLLISFFIGCSDHKTTKTNENKSFIAHNDTIISKAYLIGESWLHRDIQYSPIIIPIRNVDIDDMNRFLKDEYFGLGFYTEGKYLSNTNLHITILTTTERNDRNKMIYDSVKITPVVVMFIEKALITGNTVGTRNRYDRDGSIADDYDIRIKNISFTEFNNRTIQIAIDNRYVEVVGIKPYNKEIVRLYDYFKTSK